MSRRPFFSVVVDNHNYGRFLRECVDSVLAQDIPREDLEVVVVDDGSTDESRPILASYGDRIRAVLQERQGQAAAFNRGFSEARGEVVCLLDSDDVCLPGKLAAVRPLFDDPKVGAVQHYLQDVDAAKNPIRDDVPAWPPRYAIGDFLDARTHFAATSGLAFRRSVLELALPIPKELFYYLDDFLTARALFSSELANLPMTLGLHRVHGQNWCAGGYEDPRKMEVDFRMREIFSDHLDLWLKEFGKSLSPRYANRQALELIRRKVLYEALRARPAAAWAEWLKGLRGSGAGSFGGFRLATLFLAVLSPTLYLAAYSAYSDAPSLKGARLRAFPE